MYTKKFFLLAILLLVLTGCGKGKEEVLYLYCSETFWYVMQEECVAFYKIYGIRVIMIPIRPQQNGNKTENVVIAGGNDDASPQVPAPWQSMPKKTSSEETGSEKPKVQSVLDPEIAKQLTGIESNSFGDVFISDSQQQIDKIRELALDGGERPVVYLSLTLLTATDNPKQLTSVKSVIEGNCKLGIVNPSIDGLGEASQSVLSKIADGMKTLPLHQVRQFERQYELLDALEKGEIDAALVWDATSLTTFLLAKYAQEYNDTYGVLLKEAQKSESPEKIKAVLLTVYEKLLADKKFGQSVSLSGNPEERYVINVPMIALSSSMVIARSQRLSDFLLSNQGKLIFKKFGFLPK
ncbi:hypothetical protein FACS189419_03320 [Planctomycetales bacterium]|nr:hypothetical protein FACS189419_03320 [Planctomycetales bacterium]